MIKFYQIIGNAIAQCDDIKYIDLEGSKDPVEVFPSAIIEIDDASFDPLMSDLSFGKLHFKVTVRIKPLISPIIKPDPGNGTTSRFADTYHIIDQLHTLILSISDDYLNGVNIVKENMKRKDNIITTIMHFNADCILAAY